MWASHVMNNLTANYDGIPFLCLLCVHDVDTLMYTPFFA